MLGTGGLTMQNAMRDRLVDLLYEAEGQVNNDYPTVEMIADYLIASGVIVPPCKVGDTVYEFFDEIGFYEICELTVENIVIGVNPPKCKLYCKSKISGSKSMWYNDSFGETLFFDCESAEQKKKERLG